MMSMLSSLAALKLESRHLSEGGIEGCLAGLKVLDLSRILAGPWATQLLADLGAEVVKVERPDDGDDTRGWGPPFVKGQTDEDIFSAYFLAANRGKKSVAIDFSKPEGRDLVARLAASSDVVVENFKVGGLKRIGLDYETLSKNNPSLIYCSISGFGQTGPHRDKPGYDLLVQAMGGLMSLTGEPDGEPMKVGVAVTDILTGLYAAVAILASLHERKSSGQGQHIDLALLDVQIATLANQGMSYIVSGKKPQRHGNAHPNIVPYQAFATDDGHIVVAVGNDTQFARFAQVLGLPHLANDPRFQKNADRVRNRATLLPQIAARILQRQKSELLEALEASLIPAGPINDLQDVFKDPQVAAREMLVNAPGAAGTEMIGNPIKFSRTPVQYRSGPPSLGADTEEIVSALSGPEEEPGRAYGSGDE